MAPKTLNRETIVKNLDLDRMRSFRLKRRRAANLMLGGHSSTFVRRSAFIGSSNTTESNPVVAARKPGMTGQSAAGSSRA